MPFDIPTRIFPSLFQQVYTDNIITHKNPEWFAPLMVFYVALFVIELAIWTSFSVIRRKSYARIIITLSTKYIWTVFRLLPEIRLCQPIMAAMPEFKDNRQVVKSITGQMEIRGLKFRYAENMPLLFDGLNLTINSGDYVALVGGSGCGKSTLYVRGCPMT